MKKMMKEKKEMQAGYKNIACDSLEGWGGGCVELS